MLDPVLVRFTESLSLPFQSRAFSRAIAAVGPEDDLMGLALDLNKQKDGNEIGQLLGFASPYDGTDFYRKL
jgi:hypothetical protein